MKINTNNWNITNTENLYKNFKHNIENQQNTEPDFTSKELALIQSEQKYTEPSHSILSDKEIDILKLLFGEIRKNDEFHFYGTRKPKNVNSGFFLDVKG